MLLRIHHETKLTYSEPVTETVFEVRMAPPSDEDQTNLGFRLRINPPSPVTTYRDGFGNRADLVNLLTPHGELIVRATTIARTHRRDGEERLQGLRRDDLGPLPIEAAGCLRHSPLVGQCAELDAFVASLGTLPPMLKDLIEHITYHVRKTLKYEKKVTTAWTPVHEALTIGRGVCQDFAHLFLGACRGVGLSARYVSGYVHGEGELATHAWCQVWGGRAGWVDVDPTRGIFVANDHVVTAVGRDYSDVPPNRGVWRGRADETISVAVKVEQIDRMPVDWAEWSTPAPTNGHHEGTWTRSRRAGERRPLIVPRSGYRQQQSQQQQGL